MTSSRGSTLSQSGTLVRFVLSITFLALPALRAVTTTGSSGSLTVSVDSNGSYAVTVPALSWSFSGNIGYPLMNMAVGSGSDALGTYSEIAFDFQSDAARHATIRSYWDHPDVLFTVSYPSTGPNTFSFPNWSQYPRNLDHL